MKEKRHHNIAPLLLFAAAIFCTGAHAQSGGPLAPLGLPGPTMKSLDEVEARTPIGTVPFTITQPGSYYLTKPLAATGSDGITIAADNVTLDLNGFTLSGPGGQDHTGIAATGRRNLVVRNGIIHKFGTCLLLDGCSGVKVDGLIINPTGGGDAGIIIDSAAGWSRSVHLSDCTVEFASNIGVSIRANNGNSLHDVGFRDCRVSATNSIGIKIFPHGGDMEGVVFDRCTVTGNGAGGLTVDVRDASELKGFVLKDCLFSHNRGKGIHVKTEDGSLVKGITIDRCEISGGTDDAMVFAGTDSPGGIRSCRITRCHLSDNIGDGISVTGFFIRGFHIEGNTLMRITVGDTGIRLKDSSFPNFVFRNVCNNYGNAFDFSAGVIHGPIVTAVGSLASSGAPSHPLANFAQ